MPKIIVIYDSKSGNTEKTANFVVEGIRDVDGVDCTLLNVDVVRIEDLLEADGIVVGSPTYYGVMSGKIKNLFDESVKIHGKLEGKVGAAFTSSGGTATGAETTILSILQGFLIHGMIVQGTSNEQHYGLAIVGSPDSKERQLCKKFGNRIAHLVAKIFE